MDHSAPGPVDPRSQAWWNAQAQRSGPRPGRNAMVRALAKQGVSRTRARSDWVVLSGHEAKQGEDEEMAEDISEITRMVGEITAAVATLLARLGAVEQLQRQLEQRLQVLAGQLAGWEPAVQVVADDIRRMQTDDDYWFARESIALAGSGSTQGHYHKQLAEVAKRPVRGNRYAV